MKLNNSLHICVTGGAGYIGSHIVMNILENTKHDVIIIDNFSTGSIETILALKFYAQKNNKLLRIIILDLLKKMICCRFLKNIILAQYFI